MDRVHAYLHTTRVHLSSQHAIRREQLPEGRPECLRHLFTRHELAALLNNKDVGSDEDGRKAGRARPYFAEGAEQRCRAQIEARFFEGLTNRCVQKRFIRRFDAAAREGNVGRPGIGCVRRASHEQDGCIILCGDERQGNGRLAYRRGAVRERRVVGAEGPGEAFEKRVAGQLSTAPPAATQAFQPCPSDVTSLYPMIWSVSVANAERFALAQ